LNFGGREGWGIALGTAWAQPAAAPRIHRARIEFTLPADSPIGPATLDVQAYVVVRGSEATIVDTLVEGNFDAIRDTMQSSGVGFGAVRNIILTHYHPDHVGNLEQVAASAPQAAIFAGAADIPQITLPGRDIRPVADGAEVFGLRIIATPGHTAGHISVLDPVGSALLVGDAAFNIGELVPLFPAFTENMDQANASFVRLSGMQFQRALFGHGDEISSNASGAFRALAASMGGTAAPAPAPAPAQIPPR
jgi:glyoxylase-like metal-dependent hydrolase (beta-lactamase superfamily II)